MAETFKTEPGELDIEMTWGEPWSMSLSIYKDITDFTHKAVVVLGNGEEIEITVTPLPFDNPITVVGFTLTDEETTAMDLGIRKWYYRWTDPIYGERHVLRGKWTVKSPA